MAGRVDAREKLKVASDLARRAVSSWASDLRAPIASRSGYGALAAVAIVGGVAGALIVPGQAAHSIEATRSLTPDVTMAGVTLPMADLAVAEARATAAVQTYIDGTLKIHAGDAERTATRSSLGARIDSVRLHNLLLEVADPRSALRRAHVEAIRVNPAVASKPIELPIPAILDPTVATDAMLSLKDELDEPAHDATVDPDAHAVLPEKNGRRVDIYASLEKVTEALSVGASDVQMDTQVVAPSRTKEELAGIDSGQEGGWQVLGWFETKYARDDKHKNRTFNVHLGATKVNGTVIMPGETFDFNGTVGPRSEANGYKIAPEIASGELVDGVGGGTCQVAGTLHGAAFFAGLEIVERHPHTRPSFYIKMGLDAAVSYPTVNLKLRNPFDFPVVLHEVVDGGIARAEILGKKRTRDITFVRKIEDVTPFEEKEVDDPKIPSGQKALSQRGIPGFKIVRYRIIREGAQAVRERSQDSYPSTTQIWHRGTGDADPSFRAHDDEHPEYVADEYLATTQGGDIHSRHAKGDEEDSGGGMIESRVAGRYGTHGWTEREGFARGASGASGGTKSTK